MMRPLMFNEYDYGNNIVAKNCVRLPPMVTFQASGMDGMMTDDHYIHYGSFARAGLGTVIVEATAVTPNGRIRPFDLGLWNDEQIDGHKRLTTYLRKLKCVSIIQIG
eukprot:Trichotokara_eunicae@DN10901_c0_g1_i1.p1